MIFFDLKLESLFVIGEILDENIRAILNQACIRASPEHDFGFWYQAST